MFHLTFGEKLILLVMGPALLAIAVAVTEDVVIVEAIKEGRRASQKKYVEEAAELVV